MQYLLTAFLGSYGIVFKKSKLVYFLILLMMWLLFGWNTWNADFINYSNRYLAVSNIDGFTNDMEIGFQLLMKLGNVFGLSYGSFLKVVTLSCLLLISKTVFTYSDKKALVLSLYLIYPFIIDVTQFRNFVSMSVFIYSIRFLITGGKKNNIKYIVCILIATSIHVSGAFYLIFILIKMFDKKRLLQLSLIGSLLLTFLPQLIIIVTDFFLKDSNIGRYLFDGNKISVISTIGLVGYFCANLLLVYIAEKKIKASILEANSNSKLVEKNASRIKYADSIVKINILIMTLLPLLVGSLEFIRLFRNILVLNYILYSNAFTRRKNKVKFSDIVFGIVIFLFAIFSCWYFIYYQFPDSVFYPVFENNVIFN